MMIPFVKTYLTGNEILNISEAIQSNASGDGHYTKECHAFLEKIITSQKCLLTTSCTSSLEMSAILSEVSSGDEVIMPSYTFVSTANAFISRGARVIFADIRKDTLNINEDIIEDLITEKTKAIIPVHYAGVSCNMDKIKKIAHKYNLLVIEDAAQGILSKYRNMPLGSIGDLGCFSFHATKNIVAGEGGALTINNIKFAERAEIIREKGTNRNQFLRGQVDKYTWVDVGSSFLPNELTAAFLIAQLKASRFITDERILIWNYYHKNFEDLEHAGLVRRPIIPEECTHNAHLYYLILKDSFIRDKFIFEMKKRDIQCTFHYIPLHSSPFYKNLYPKDNEHKFKVTNDLSSRIVRLPLWVGLKKFQDEIIENVRDVIKLLN